jgi:hypothetical protein
MECEYCKKVFSTLRVKMVHQKTTKTCLIIQDRMGISNEKITYPCTFCSKHFTTKVNQKYHLNICKQKLIKTEVDVKSELDKNELNFELERTQYQLEIQKKEEEINELKEKLKTPKITKIKQHTNIETNIEQQNNITIYQIMSPEHVETFFKKYYNLDTLLGGQKALARFVNDGFLKEAPVYLCGDRSRQKFYIIKDGEKMEDPDCDEILGLTSPGMPYVQEVYETALFSDLPEKVSENDVQDNYQQIINMDEQRTDFKTELSKIISTTSSDKLTFKTTLKAMKNRSEKLGLMERQNKD